MSHYNTHSLLCFTTLNQLNAQTCSLDIYITINILPRQISFVPKSTAWFYAVFFWFYSLKMVPCRPKQVGTLSAILQNKYLRNKYANCVGLVS